MKTIVKLIILLISGVISISSVWVNAGEKEDQCISLIKQSTAALVARDWDNLERINKDRLKYCKGVENSENLSEGYANIAIANNEQERPKLALDACESCIKTYYGNPSCHLEKAKALMKLGRKKESLKTLDSLELNEGDLTTQSSLDRQIYEAKKYNFESMLGFIKAFREANFSNHQ
jgi:tetratricopeptide (TPR) repeat protein